MGHSNRRRTHLLEWALLICSIVAMFMLFEGYFRYFRIVTDGFNFTLSARQWFREHWRPINSQGLRDVEHDFSTPGCKVFVVGDSFVAGHGIENIDDTFGRRLQLDSGDAFEVALVGKNALDTQGEFELLQSLGHTPDLMVLSHFVNDVEGALMAAGKDMPHLVDMPGGLLAMVNHSYLLNHIYWRVFKTGDMAEASRNYTAWIDSGYTDPKIFALHQQALREFVEYARKNESPLIVVVWPFLSDVTGSLKYTVPVVRWFQEQGVTVLDLGTHFQGRPPEELVVNPFDAHPNVATSAEVASLLLPLVEQRLPASCGKQ